MDRIKSININKKGFVLKRYLVITITLAFLSAFAVMPIYADTFIIQPEGENNSEYIQFLMNVIKENYKYDITEEELYKGVYKGMFDALDVHSTYFTSDEFDNFNASAFGEFGGIGITVTANEDGYIDIIAPIEDTPGFRAGIQAGDIIIKVNGEDIKEWTLEKAMSVMRGEPGTKVTLGIKRSGVENLINFDITREIIKVNPVKYSIEDEMGILKISSFNANTSENVLNAIGYFKENDVKGLVIDLRGNPGGSLTEVLKVADYFVSPGKELLYIDYKGDNDEIINSSTIPVFTGKPIAVLINDGSASASEILSGILQDYGIAEIIGQNSYGKGTVQTVLDLTNGGGIKLTIAEYLTPGRHKIDGVGIKPDIEVSNLPLIQKETVSKLVPMSEIKDYSVMDSIGLNVYGAQERLKLLGYDVDVDGKYSKKTMDSLIKFQKDYNLKADGILGKATRDKLTYAVTGGYLTNDYDKQLEKAIIYLKK